MSKYNDHKNDYHDGLFSICLFHMRVVYYACGILWQSLLTIKPNFITLIYQVRNVTIALVTCSMCCVSSFFF